MGRTAKRLVKRDPKASRQALVDATLDTIADIGLTETTVTNIIRRAGLSRGMVHLHFGGKDNLLTEATRYFSDQYYARMDRLTEIGDAAPEVQVMAVVAADLSEDLLNPRSAKIWHAFRGAASSHPGIAKYSSTQDDRLVGVIRSAFEDIAKAAGMPGDTAQDATYGTLALLEGMWVHYLVDTDSFSRADSKRLVRRFLAGLYPDHFSDRSPHAQALTALVDGT